MVQRLSSTEAAERKEAGEYLYAFCLQTEADERSGRTKRSSGMKLGGGPNAYSTEIRLWMADDLSDATFHGNGEEAFETARWLYQHDTWSHHRDDAVKALARIRTPAADKLFVQMIQRAESQFTILTMALRQAAARDLVEAADSIRPLCRHYDANVREAALAAASRLGLKDVGQYDPQTDLGPRIERWLRTLLTVLPEKIPPSARWHRLTVPSYGSRAADAVPLEMYGWLVDEDGNSYRVIDWTDHPRTWTRKEAQVRPESLAEFAERMVKVREKFEGSKDDSERRKLQEDVGVLMFMTWGGHPWTGSVPEVLAAAWSLERGERATCARLIVPLMKGADDEKEALDYFGNRIAVEIDKRMLTAFTTRDYNEALRLAKLLVAPFFDGFPHQDRAKGLVATLPERTEDFKALSLVAPANWQSLKKQYSRQQQIEYLAKRLRLIHATQASIPGGIDYSDTQYLPEDAPEGQIKRTVRPFLSEGTEAINPYCELLCLNLTGAEMLQLVPYLESPDYILAYDLYRFLPQDPQCLHKVSWVAASILNAVSQKDVVDVGILEGQAAEARRRHIDELRKWCADHAAVTHADNLARTVKQAEEWQDVRWAFWGLRNLDDERALKLIFARCDGDPEHKSDLARLLCLLDRKEYVSRRGSGCRTETSKRVSGVPCWC